MKITYKTIEYDYKNYDELCEHHKQMNTRGWALVKKYEINEGNYKWHGIYNTGKLFNGINGR